MKKAIALVLLTSSISGCFDNSIELTLNDYSESEKRTLEANGVSSSSSIYYLSKNDLSGLKKLNNASHDVRNYLNGDSMRLTVDPDLFGSEFASNLRSFESEKESYIGRVVRKKEIELATMNSVERSLSKQISESKSKLDRFEAALSDIRLEVKNAQNKISDNDSDLEVINNEVLSLVRAYIRKNNLPVHVYSDKIRILSQGRIQDESCVSDLFAEGDYVFFGTDIDNPIVKCSYVKLPKELKGLFKGERASKYIKERIKSYSELYYETYGTHHFNYNSRIGSLVSELDRLMKKEKRKTKNQERKENVTENELKTKIDYVEKERKNSSDRAIELEGIIKYDTESGFKNTPDSKVTKAYSSAFKSYSDKYHQVIEVKFSYGEKYQTLNFKLNEEFVIKKPILISERVSSKNGKVIKKEVWITTYPEVINRGSLLKSGSKPAFVLSGVGVERDSREYLVDNIHRILR